MSDLVLGAKPDQLTVDLTTGADYAQTIEAQQLDGTPIPWPDGVTVTLEFATGQTWTANVTGPDAVFTADHAQADLIPPGTPVALVFTQGGLRQIPNRGRVSRG